MPLYEYQCRECGHRFERIRKFSDAPLTECPSCGGEVEKLFSAPAIQFKGQGWYITDYARKSESSSGSKDAGESGDSKDAKHATERTKDEAASSGSDKASKDAGKPAAAPDTTSSSSSGTKSDKKSDGKKTPAAS
jgi:putative FmdB family regulatory protein